MLSNLLQSSLNQQRARGGLAAWVFAALFLLVCGRETSAQAPGSSLQFTSSSYTVPENNGSVRIAVSRFGDASAPASVTFTASNGSAISGQDFVARMGVLNFGVNEVQKTFDILILDNVATNLTKTINLSLSAAGGNAIVGFPSTASIAILDDETGAEGLSAGVFEFSAALYRGTDTQGEHSPSETYIRDPNRVLNDPGIWVTVVRTGGSRGRVIVDVDTFDTEYSNTNVYRPVSTSVVFDDYQMSERVLIPTRKYTNFLRDLNFNLSCVSTNTNGVWNPTNLVCQGTGTLFPFFAFATNINDTFEFYFETNNTTLNGQPFLFYTQGTGLRIAPHFSTGVRLSNPRPFPGEDPAVIQPTLGDRNTANVDITVTGGIIDDGSIVNNSGRLPTGMGYSFERLNYYVSEGAGVLEVYVNKDMSCPDAAIVRYRVNNRNNPSAEGDHELRSFALESGSDYAHPFADYLPPGSAPWWVARGGGNGDAVITWGLTENAPKPAYIYINQDELVEFQEDLLIQLYHRPGDCGFRATPTASISIVHDNIVRGFSITTNAVYGGEVTAGAGDRRYNREGFSESDPPLNLNPGANNEVHAVAIQPDGKLVLGGEFTAVNTHPRLRIARMLQDGQIDHSFNVGGGADQAVTAIVVQPDGKTIIGGLFTSYNNIIRRGVARINTDGSIDTGFNPGLGANAAVRALALQRDGKILVGGEFTAYNGTPRNYIARLNSDGSLDASFDPGDGPDGFVQSIAVTSNESFTVKQSSTLTDRASERTDTYDTGSTEGTLVLQYDFSGAAADEITVYNGTQLLGRTGLVNGPGALTLTYGPGGSSYITVRVNEGRSLELSTLTSWNYALTMIPKTDDLPVIGGRFRTYGGVSRNGVARLTDTGALDTSFTPGFAAEDGIVYAVVKHGRKVFAGGTFSFFDRLSRGRIVGLNENGSVDLSYDPGTGFNDIVYSLVMHQTGKVMAGGLFTEFNGSRRTAMARLRHNGKLDSTFMDTAYNQFAGLPNQFSFESEKFVRAMAYTQVTNIFDLEPVTNIVNDVTNITFPTFSYIYDHLYIGGNFQRIGAPVDRRDQMLPRQNFARVMAHETPGPGMLELMRDTYSVDENSGFVFITANRDDGHLGGAFARFATRDLTLGPGAARDQVDYDSTYTTFVTPTVRWPSVYNRARQRSEAERGPNNVEYFVSYQDPGERIVSSSALYVSVLDDTVQEGDEQLEVTLNTEQQFVTLGGEPIPIWPALGRSTARLTIVDNDFSPGVIGFEFADYTVNENGAFATITLTRTDGSDGQVSVDYRTLTGGTARPWDPSPIDPTNPFDYDAISIGTVSFGPGETTRSFTVRIRDDTRAELDETVFLELRNPVRATLGRQTARLTILDNDFTAGRLAFSAPTFTAVEDQRFATVTVRRTGGSQGVTSVRVSTQDGTGPTAARANIDYEPVTDFDLRWEGGDTTPRTIQIPLINNGNVDGNRTFSVLVHSPSVAGAIGNQAQSTVVIQDDDAFGNLRFSNALYTVDENSSTATITVVRVGGIAQEVTVDYATTPELATEGQDYTAASGSFRFAPGQTAATFTIPILDDDILDGTKTVILTLSNQRNWINAIQNVPGTLGQPAQATLQIIDNELDNLPAGSVDVSFLAEGANDYVYTVAQQADGRLLLGGDFTTVNSVLRNRLARINEDGTIDTTFGVGAGPNASVRVIRVQEDSRILIAGSFTAIGSTNRNGIARLNADGLVDQTFNPGAGANNPVYAMTVQNDAKILIGGDFSTYGPASRNGLARLNRDGTIDASFSIGTGAGGAQITVYAIAVQLDGKILVGGSFSSFNEAPANRLVRLNRDGSLDTSFNMSVGAGGSEDVVRAIALQADGKILVGGRFGSFNGSPVGNIVRLNTDGTVDPTFIVGAGADGAVNVIDLQLDGKILVGGDFLKFNNITRRGITRLLMDGRNDPSINFGSGANGSVASLIVQADRKIVLVGGFTEFAGEPHLRLVRIHGGSIRGAGSIEFVRSLFVVSESATNAVVTIRRVGGTEGEVRVQFGTRPDPTVPAGSAARPFVDYTPVSMPLTFPEGETQVSVQIPVLDDTEVEPDRIAEVFLANPTGGATLGFQPTARLVITSDDSSVNFGAASYSVGESIVSGTAAITVTRTGAVSLPVSLTFYTTDGTATSPADYTSVSNTVTFARGESEATVFVPIAPDQLVEGNHYLNLHLTNLVGTAVFAGGGNNLTTRLTIIDDDFAPGEITFARPSFSQVEMEGVSRVVTVNRVNGVTGVVTVRYRTQAVSATPNVDYTDVSGILTFGDGVTSQVIEIPVFDDALVEGNEVVTVTLSEIAGGATLIAPTSATFSIVDNDRGSGSLDDTFNPGTGANAPIRAIELDGRRFVIGGDFTAYNSDPARARITRILESGAQDPAFSTENRPNNSVTAIAIQPNDRRILIGGSFNFISHDGISDQQNRIARLLENGAYDASFKLPLGLNAPVLEIIPQPDQRIIIGGLFEFTGAAERRRIARLESNGNLDLSFTPGTGADNGVYAVARQADGKVLIGGQFLTVNGVTATRLARLNANGSIDLSFAAAIGSGANGTIYDILILPGGNEMVIVGDFTAFNGQPRPRVAKLTSAGALVAGFRATGSINGAVRTVELQTTDFNSDSKLIIGGAFTSVDDRVRNRVARLNVDGTFDSTLDVGDGPNGTVLDIVVQPWDGRIVVIGEFTEFNNRTSFSGIARINNDAAFLPPTGDLTVSSVSVLGTSVNIEFTSVAGATYEIKGTSDFVTWTTVRTVTGTAGTTATSVPVSGPYQFYVVERQ